MLNNRGTEIQTYTIEMILVSIVSPKDSRGVSGGVVRKISSCLRKIGCRVSETGVHAFTVEVFK